jgi:hypothetical protein
LCLTGLTKTTVNVSQFIQNGAKTTGGAYTVTERTLPINWKGVPIEKG